MDMTNSLTDLHLIKKAIPSQSLITNKVQVYPWIEMGTRIGPKPN